MRDSPGWILPLRAALSPDRRKDVLFLSVVVVLSLALYVFRLGFYSDDWTVLGYASMSDGSFIGVFNAIYGPEVQMRPVQFLYLAGLYSPFGADPTVFHLFGGLTFLSGIILFYLVLRELDQPRRLALAVVLVYALLPHFSTVRFWISTSQIVLSMALYFLSFYADLRAIRPATSHRWSWKAIAVASLLASALAYELFLTLLVLSPLIIWYRLRRQSSGPGASWTGLKTAGFAAINLIALAPAVVFKLLVTTRAESGGVPYSYHIEWFVRLMRRSLRVSFGTYGFGLPFRISQIAEDYFEWQVFALALATGLIVFAYLYRISDGSGDGRSSHLRMAAYAGTGLLVFFLGYSIFLTNYNALVTATGIGNRIALAAAVGVAFTFVGAAGWLTAFLKTERLRRGLFCALVALLCTGGFIINNTIASFWTSAWHRQEEVLEDLFRHFPELPAGSTVLLDGTCPYVGPGIVFESPWDLQGALLTRFRDYEVLADVITPETKVEDDAIRTYIYGHYTAYPYGDDVFIYHAGKDVSYRMTDARAARRYFDTHNPDMNGECPSGEAGFGASIFDARFRYF